MLAPDGSLIGPSPSPLASLLGLAPDGTYLTPPVGPDGAPAGGSGGYPPDYSVPSAPPALTPNGTINPVAAGPATGGMAGAHHSFLASVIAHLLGAAGGIHGFGPGGAVGAIGGGAHSNFPQSLPSPGIGPAQALHGLGANAQAAQVWEQHHPGAMAGRAPIPHWVTQSLLAAIHAHTPQQVAPPPAPSFQAQ